jgi:hypothetical protein
MKNLRILSVTCLAVLPLTSGATTLNFDTGSAVGWTASGGGAIAATPYVIPNYPNYGNSVLSVTSTGNNLGGTFLPGGSVAGFDGFWTATYSFFLPANATGVQFSYSNFFADGRAVLELNGNIVGSAGFATSGGGYNGVMVFSDGAAAQPYTFNGSLVSGSSTTGFLLGQVNLITAIINNTTGSCADPMVGLVGADGTGMGLAGSLTYSVPEPSAVALFLIPLLSAWGVRKVGFLRTSRLAE